MKNEDDWAGEAKMAFELMKKSSFLIFLDCFFCGGSRAVVGSLVDSANNTTLAHYSRSTGTLAVCVTVGGAGRCSKSWSGTL